MTGHSSASYEPRADEAKELALISVDFLRRTLIERPSIQSRNGVSYLSVRAWRQSIKPFQMDAIKSLKRYGPHLLAETISGEFAHNIEKLLGNNAFSQVVPIPCGHSKREDCLSVAIAMAVGERLSIPVVYAFEHQRLDGVSTPKANARRPKLILRTPVSAPVLLVDDIATSGSHIEEAVKTLRPHCGTVFPIVWIGSTVSRLEGKRRSPQGKRSAS